MSHPPLWAPFFPPLPRKSKGTIEVGVEVIRGVCQAWHCDYSDYESISRAQASNGLGPSCPPGGSDLRGKEADIWLEPMMPGNWALGREDTAELEAQSSGYALCTNCGPCP
jgi:hypothetical protein